MAVLDSNPDLLVLDEPALSASRFPAHLSRVALCICSVPSRARMSFLGCCPSQAVERPGHRGAAVARALPAREPRGRAPSRERPRRSLSKDNSHFPPESSRAFLLVLETRARARARARKHAKHVLSPLARATTLSHFSPRRVSCRLSLGVRVGPVAGVGSRTKLLNEIGEPRPRAARRDVRRTPRAARRRRWPASLSLNRGSLLVRTSRAAGCVTPRRVVVLSLREREEE